MVVDLDILCTFSIITKKITHSNKNIILYANLSEKARTKLLTIIVDSTV